LKKKAMHSMNQGLANAETKDFGPSFKVKYNNELKESEAETVELTPKWNGLSAPNAETPHLSDIVRRHSVPVTPQMENGTSQTNMTALVQ